MEESVCLQFASDQRTRQNQRKSDRTRQNERDRADDGPAFVINLRKMFLHDEITRAINLLTVIHYDGVPSVRTLAIYGLNLPYLFTFSALLILQSLFTLPSFILVLLLLLYSISIPCIVDITPLLSLVLQRYFFSGIITLIIFLYDDITAVMTRLTFSTFGGFYCLFLPSSVTTIF